MKSIVHKAETRGHANHGWLDSWHSFSFAGYHNPERVHFGALRVLNDDSVSGGMGFGRHPHDNMEIVSIPLVGALDLLQRTEPRLPEIGAAEVGAKHAEKQFTLPWTNSK